MLHVQHFDYLREHKRSMVRRYLLDSGDIDRLRLWDSGAFSDNEDDGRGVHDG